MLAVELPESLELDPDELSLEDEAEDPPSEDELLVDVADPPLDELDPDEPRASFL